MKNIINNFITQNYPSKELIIVLNNNQLNLSEWLEYCRAYRDIQVYQLDESVTTGECINFAVQRAKGAYIARFDDDDHYCPKYLRDMLGYFSFTKAAILGKTSHFIYYEDLKLLAIFYSGSGFCYTDFMLGATQIIKREVFESVSYPHYNNAEDLYFCNACQQAGFELYSCDPFNYLRMRYAVKNYHTWQIDDAGLLKHCTSLLNTITPKYLADQLTPSAKIISGKPIPVAQFLNMATSSMRINSTK